MPRKQQSKATSSKAAKATKRSTDLDLDVDDDLDALFAEALAATEQRARAQAAPLDDDGYFDIDEADQSMHFMVEDSLGPGDLEPPVEDDDGEPTHGPEFSFDDLAFMQESTPTEENATPSSVTSTLDDLDAELKAALQDDDEDADDDLQAEMEKLLAESFGVPVDDSITDDDDEEILAAGDDGAHVISGAADAEIARYRNQIGELSRLLSTRDLELRTVDDRVETLESQMVATARQSANIGREFESFRKRSEREREELEKFAGEKIIKEFLGVHDNFERALEHAGEDRNGPLGQGVEMILGQLRLALKRCGVESVDSSQGTPFDPAFHEAVGQEYSDTIESGGIVTEMQAGFTLRGRLVRAAMVTVSQGPYEKPAAAPKKKSTRKKKSGTEAKKATATKSRKSAGSRTPPKKAKKATSSPRKKSASKKKARATTASDDSE